MKFDIERGELYYADLDPVEGSEQGGVRPVLIIQNDTGNKFSTTTIIAPISSYKHNKKEIPTHYILNRVLENKSFVLMEQIRVIDKMRLIRYLGKLKDNEMDQIDEMVAISLGLERKWKSTICNRYKSIYLLIICCF